MKLPSLGQVQNAVTQAVQEAKDLGADKQGGPDPIAETLTAVKDGFDQTRPARDFAYGVVTSDGAWGQSVPVDTGTETPMRVGYGEKLRTIAEVSTPKLPGQPDGVQLVGGHARVFGDASASTLSAAIGIESELGFKLSGRGQGDAGSSFGEIFVGARNRNTVEVGVLGSSIGSDAFVGGEAFGSEKLNMDEGSGDDSNTLSMAAQIQAGFRAGAHVAATATGLSGDERMELGVRGRAEAERDITLVGPIGTRLAGHADAFAGMTEGLHFKGGLSGLSAGGEWFAGVRAGAEARWALSFAQHELVGVGVKGEAWAGLGAKANAGLGYDSSHKQVKGNVDAGLAIGVGVDLGTELTFGGDGLTDLGDGGKASTSTGTESSNHGTETDDNLK